MHLLVALSVFKQSRRKASLCRGYCSTCRYLLYLAFIPAIVVICSIPFVNFVPHTQKSELSTQPQFCTTGRLPKVVLYLEASDSGALQLLARPSFFSCLVIPATFAVQLGMHSIPVAKKKSNLISLFAVESHLDTAAEELSRVCKAKLFCLLFLKQALPSTVTYSQTD